MCLGAVYWCRPRKVYYAASRVDAANAGFDDDHIYRQLTLPHPDRIIPFEQTGQEKVKKIFGEWSRKNLNNLY
jgi:tRNA(Arg) A34 adenosine deaminase TadA